MIAVGAIIAFALKVHVGFLDLSVVGWILMVAGAIGLVLTLSIFNSRRRTVVSSTTTPPPVAPGERRVVDQPVVSEYDQRPY
jgi:diacylglycerol kinase